MPETIGSTAQALPDYQNPPLNEIAIGILFEPLNQWQTRHVGQFWSEVSKEYPATEDQPPILDVEQAPRLQHLPRRTFLVSQDQNFVIQLQESRFLFNWRKRKDDDVYPRFDAFFQKFLQAWAAFSKFVERERLGQLKPIRYELSYINHLEQTDKPVATTAEQYVRMFDWSTLHATFLPPPSGINTIWTFQLPEPLGVGQANLGQGKRADGREVLVFIMSCVGAASPRVSMNDWFAAAHQWLTRGFSELITESAQQAWGYKT
jgi:uncharacterized protein (TIGR04255 family)